jgi:hypothetical protein
VDAGAIKKLNTGNGGVAVGIVILCSVELEICPPTRGFPCMKYRLGPIKSYFRKWPLRRWELNVTALKRLFWSHFSQAFSQRVVLLNNYLYCAPFSISMHTLDAEVAKMEWAGLVVKTKSTWTHNIVVIRRKSGSPDAPICLRINIAFR